VDLSDPGSGGIYVNWSSVSPDVHYNVTATDRTGRTTSALTEKNSTSVRIRGLHSNTAYNLTVAAVVRVGDVLLAGNCTKPILFTTLTKGGFKGYRLRRLGLLWLHYHCRLL